MSVKPLRRLLPWALILLIAALSYWRAPNLFHDPRIWAEEGAVYLSTAYYSGFWRALVVPHQGYYALVPNVATLLALGAGIPRAAMITTLVAFIVQLLPIALIAFSRSQWWQRPAVRLIGVLIVLLAASSGEVWLNTINSQFYLAVATFLILAEDGVDETPVRSLIYAAILLMAGLTAWYPVLCCRLLSGRPRSCALAVPGGRQPPWDWPHCCRAWFTCWRAIPN
ncbi:MAG: hypothetical protein GXY52_00275 [Chloroflexi bacterium]|nr:hypothetical protein [Chloroflexota bacterium]